MKGAKDSSTDRPAGRFGLRYEDMSEEELEYYRVFWQKPTPAAGDPDYEIPAHYSVKARIRMANGLSFTLLLVGLLLAFIPLLASNIVLSSVGALITLAGVTLLIAVRRRLFASLRIPGQPPLPHHKKKGWFWFPHLLTLAGLVSALVAIAMVPRIFSGAEPNVIRSYGALWGEITLMLWLLAALFYGLISLAVYTPEDTDDSVLRPTDFAEQQLKKDLAHGKHRGEDLYDSDWITGR